MYILFINSSGKCDIYFFNVGWVGLDLCDGLGWVEFFLTHHSGLGQKIISTRLIHTPTFYFVNKSLSPCKCVRYLLFSIFLAMQTS